MILQWRHNERDGVSHHQPHECLLNRLSKRHQSSALLAFVWGQRWQKASNAEKFPFDDVIKIFLMIIMQPWRIRVNVFMNPPRNIIQPQYNKARKCVHMWRDPQYVAYHYSDIIMSAMGFQITGDCLLNRLFMLKIKENTKVSRHWPL